MECRDCESKDRKNMSNENRVRVGLHWRQCVGPEAGVEEGKEQKPGERLMHFEQEIKKYGFSSSGKDRQKKPPLFSPFNWQE